VNLNLHFKGSWPQSKKEKMNRQLQPSTWRLLGLTAGSGYTAVGAVQVIFPSDALRFLFSNHSQSPDISLLGTVLGARDLTVTAAIFALHYVRSQEKAMGIVILSSTISQIGDVVGVFLRKGFLP
jgi:hypothetical protein